MPTSKKNAKTIFLNAAEISSATERQAYVDAECGDDDTLRRDVEEFLKHQQEMGAFLEAGLANTLTTVDETAMCESPGTVIDRFKLLEPIGEGGFGVVFLAEQTEPVRRKVALKIIKPGMDTKQVIARFEAERQALALMDHPSIAHVLDAGSTESGRPYFVMELVRGVPITEYCDQNNMPIRERLKLFVETCKAVQHAHHKGIIHRDIKPGNVQVTLQDGRPVVKVIDFGIAKAMTGQLTDKTLTANFGQLIGTPLYMSPEQAELSGLDVDTRSDIYSLGVLLYELLTGTTPVEKSQLQDAGLDAIRQMIRAEEPPRPSARISALVRKSTTVSAQRQVEPQRLKQLLRGELDWIVMKALEKDRDRRYETANGFARDVERYLNNEPVHAYPPSMGYKLRKFLRRNRVALGTAAMVVSALVIGIVLTTWQAIRATDAERLAKNRLLAVQEAEHDKTLMLYKAYLSEARALRQTGWAGHRFGSLDAVRKAAKLLRELGASDEKILELRNEWIACSALPVDLRLIRQVAKEGSWFTADAGMKTYSFCDSKYHIHIRRFADDKEIPCVSTGGDSTMALTFKSKTEPNS